MDNSNDNDPITVVEFCAGYGGLGLGIKRVLGKRMRLIGLCELEGFAQANLISKMEAGLMAQVPIWSNLLTFPYGKFRGLVDIAVAGIPCQPHSLAGKRKGGGDERFLFDDWLRGLEQMQPKYILIENVEGLLSSKMPDGTLCIAWTIERLEAMGYKATAGIFSAREVGAPHQRKRVFILAYRDGKQGQLSDWWRESAEQVPVSNGEERRAWPSRPGQPQHEWEPPRVVGNTQHDGSHQCGSETRGTESCGEQGWVQESEGGSASMGNATHGSNGQHTSEQQGWDTFGRPSAEGVSMGDTSMQRPQRRTHGEFRQSDEVKQLERSNAESGKWNQTQPSLGGDSDGTTSGMDYAELSDADSAMREDYASSFNGTMADSICGRGQQTGIKCRYREVDEDQGQEEGARNKQAVVSHNESNDGGGDYAQLSITCDNRTDELRLLGNGVVPATAERAFRTLLAELIP